MSHEFLSTTWFEEAEKIRAEINPPVPDAVKDLVINLKVAGGPDGDIEAKMAAGKFELGLAADAPTTLNVPYDVAKKMFIEGDQQASMQAFMSGQIKVEGDMAKLMQMQTAGAPSAESIKVQELIKEMTA
ncbi:MAG: SCP2 sterol-binding domain-containing protein [bacterium]|nr:SCP2 sterol-binding domain-containing protein [bacterium]